jgi:hypothetical protein
VALDVEGERVAVPLADVLRAKLLLTDELIKAVQDAQQGADDAASAEGGITGVGQ